MTVEIFEMTPEDLVQIARFVEQQYANMKGKYSDRSEEIEIRKEKLGCNHVRFTVFVKRYELTPEEDAPWNTTYIEHSTSFTRRMKR